MFFLFGGFPLANLSRFARDSSPRPPIFYCPRTSLVLQFLGDGLARSGRSFPQARVCCATSAPPWLRGETRCPWVVFSFFPAAPKYFVLSFHKFGYAVSWRGFLWVYSIWSPFSFLNLWVDIFCHIWEISSYCFLTFCFSPAHVRFRDSSNTNTGSLVILPQVPETQLILFFECTFSDSMLGYRHLNCWGCLCCA